MMLRLPVSHVEFDLAPPVGADDLLLLEAPRLDLELAIELGVRLARNLIGAVQAIDQLPVPDLDALFLLLRQRWLGDTIRAEALCPHPSCRKRIDVSFRISDYLAHHQPGRSAQALPEGNPGWFRLSGNAACFRLPTTADLIAVQGSANPVRELVGRCVRPAPQPAAVLTRIERAMAAMAPILCHELETSCPECSATIRLRFDPVAYTLTELRSEAVSVHEDVHALASTYHWPEADILALPRRRRAMYAEMAREQTRSA